jgi:hypothetical protein
VAVFSVYLCNFWTFWDCFDGFLLDLSLFYVLLCFIV